MARFGALPDAVHDGDVVTHFGNPLIEQRQLAAGQALSPLADRALVEITGEDRLTWLDSITSQFVAQLAPGDSTELLVLDPQGRVEHAAGVLEDGTTVWLIADAADAEKLAAWLQRMVFRSRVTVTLRADALLVGFFAGGAAEARIAASTPNGVPLIWRDPWTHTQPGGHQYAAAEGHPAAEFSWSIAVVDDAARLKGPFAGALAAEALRIAAWRPRWSHEVDERSIPHESDWIRSAVHMSKGCYRGQETVAKVHNLGHPPRRLTALHLDGTEVVLPARGDAVFAGDDEVGQITSAALHYEDGPIALAILSRRAPVGDLIVHTEGTRIAAAQQVIVPADAGATAGVPRLTRLSRRPEGVDPRNAG
ncbi:Folate-dependent protein for Fe/S cluster synthesis/repair in oxidative stress [Microbacterium esteraromaticum]|uniref:Folate-dependent protein for Fe/S cluster synthesis/repair in oxidative stress n=1 Tax=Microbacterium esteraromaticum TaxID=57043 RepID=A0A1R4I683_9MICO|nr:folate-binding protein YgfZ [Microbacterium esteraromaticum]SJN15391.1 Folate-dependent protein for Fe/S cluster synthesis/repair in oxidative stress [Microbacterium esteraromaticum]